MAIKVLVLLGAVIWMKSLCRDISRRKQQTCFLL